MNFKKLSTSAALATMMFAGNAMAATALCSGSDIDVPGASCIGFIDGNLNGNNPSLAEINDNLGVWGVHLTAPVASTSMLSGLTGNTINFAQQLYLSLIHI